MISIKAKQKTEKVKSKKENSSKKFKQEKFYLTTAIPYVNAAPHLGHALEFIQTDVIARYQLLLNKDVSLTTGADENSLKNVQAAESKGITPAELCETNAAIFKKMAQKVGLSFTSFIRSSVKEEHWVGPQKLWDLCDKAGDIYKKDYRGLYCVGCESFYDETELPGGICSEHKTKPELIQEENYFFRLSKYQKKLEQLLESGELKIFPDSRKNEVLSFIKDGLKDFSISRSVSRAKNWGVPVPGDRTQIQYVWFDALTVYLTGIGYGKDEKRFKKYWPANVHVIGKGILRFHAIYWPAILLSAGLPLPKGIFVHGYITVEGQKMSKTLGNIVDPIHLVEKYGVDPLRYFLLSGISTFEDGDFSERLLIEKNNNELVANLGNLVNRTLVFTQNNFDSSISKSTNLTEADKLFLEEQQKLIKEIKADFDSYRLDETIRRILSFSSSANKYFQENAPWKSVKEDKARCGHVTYILLNQIKDLAILIGPFLPETSNSIFTQLNLNPKKWNDLGKLSLVAGKKLGKPQILFKKIDPIKAEKSKAEFSDKQFKEVDATFRVSDSAAALGIKAAAAILEVKAISNKNSELENLKKQKFKLEDSGYIELHKKVGAEELSSINWLHDLSSKKGQIPNINTLVDAYNLISLKQGISAGAHDISKIKGDVRIDICDGAEDFTEIGTTQAKKIKKGEYAAIDDEKIICRLELKQCEQTKIKKETKKVLLYYQGHSKHNQDQLNTALKEACELIIKVCGGSYRLIYPEYKEEEEKFSFKHLDIEVGEILSAEKHPNAERLLIEKVKLGDKEIQLVSGIAQFYKTEELVGKKIIILRNLKPVVLRGVQSQGMLLVAESKDKSKVEIVSPSSPVGSKIELKGEEQEPKTEITADDYFKLKIEIKDGKIYSEGKQLITETGEELKTSIKEGKVY